MPRRRRMSNTVHPDTHIAESNGRQRISSHTSQVTQDCHVSSTTTNLMQEIQR